MVSPTRIPPAQVRPAGRPPRRMLRTVTSVSGPGSSTMSVAATVKVASAMSMPPTLNAGRTRGPGQSAGPGPAPLNGGGPSCGGTDLDAAFARLRSEDGVQPLPGAESVDHAGQVLPVQPAYEPRRAERQRVERTVAQPH